MGLLFATIVTLWSWIGGLVLPFINSPKYKRILAGMIALACGCVLSNSLLKFVPLVCFNKFYLLIPGVFENFVVLIKKAVGNELVNLDNPEDSYFLKHVLFICIIFFFFNFERAMKLYAFYKKEQVITIKLL